MTDHRQFLDDYYRPSPPPQSNLKSGPPDPASSPQARAVCSLMSIQEAAAMMLVAAAAMAVYAGAAWLVGTEIAARLRTGG